MYREYELFRLGRQVVEWVFELFKSDLFTADISLFFRLKLADNYTEDSRKYLFIKILLSTDFHQ
jgi:hypothetical protein